MIAKEGTYYSHGKVLLTGEYAVLDGVKSLALPTKKGQSTRVEFQREPRLSFISKDHLNQIWFTAEYSLELLEKASPAEVERTLIATNNNEVAGTLTAILSSILKQNTNLLSARQGLLLTSSLEFPGDWGLGSSSTFISNLAQWSNTDPYQILGDSLGGSGYDLACATADTPIFYQRCEDNPRIAPAPFSPSFREQLYFVHLNQKQNSREGIKHYRERAVKSTRVLERLSTLSEAISTCETLNTFNSLIEEHESLIGDLIGISPVKERLFRDFPGSIKSLGAWGGDFILVSAKEDPALYFHDKGYPTLISYKDFIL